MSHRTQITLEDAQYERLLGESKRTGLGLAELVRRALDATYGPSSSDDRRRALDFSFGAVVAIELDGAAYVDQLRRGLGRRISS
jgi:hypothetical protein